MLYMYSKFTVMMFCYYNWYSTVRRKRLKTCRTVPIKLINMTWSFLPNLFCSSSERTSKTRRLYWHPKVVFNKEIIDRDRPTGF
jgi:hypothetical protein